VSDSYSTPSEQFLSHIMGRRSYIWWDDDHVNFVLDQQDYYSASSLKQHSTGRHWDTLSWFWSNSLCSYSFNAKQRSSKYQFHSLWFYPTGTWTHDLLHLRWARKPLYHRYGWHKIRLEILFFKIKLYFFFFKC
jgi:hypothetical protein